MSFLVIAVADRLSTEETDRALDAGPAHVEAGDGYPFLLQAVGFEDVELLDVTDEYLATLAAWAREWDTESPELEQLIGTDQFAAHQSRRRKALKTVQDGLLRRYLITAVRP